MIVVHQLQVITQSVQPWPEIGMIETQTTVHDHEGLTGPMGHVEKLGAVDVRQHQRSSGHFVTDDAMPVVISTDCPGLNTQWHRSSAAVTKLLIGM